MEPADRSQCKRCGVEFDRDGRMRTCPGCRNRCIGCGEDLVGFRWGSFRCIACKRDWDRLRRIPESVRREVLAITVCALCRSYTPEEIRAVDHIIPADKGGSSDRENLRMLCRRCNSRKGAKMPEAVRRETWCKPKRDQPFLMNPNWRP
jgi:5-methylcytosine-specific restriction endonuclease McrA